MNLKNIKFTFLFLFFFIINISGVNAYIFTNDSVTLCTYEGLGEYTDSTYRTKNYTHLYVRVVPSDSGATIGFSSVTSAVASPSEINGNTIISKLYTEGTTITINSSISDICPDTVYLNLYGGNYTTYTNVCFGSEEFCSDSSNTGSVPSIASTDYEMKILTLDENPLHTTLNGFESSYSATMFSNYPEQSKCDAIVGSDLFYATSNNTLESYFSDLLLEQINLKYNTNVLSMPTYMNMYTDGIVENLSSTALNFWQMCEGTMSEEDQELVDSVVDNLESYNESFGYEFDTDLEGCDLIAPLVDEINGIFSFIQVGLIGLLIALTLLDFFKALTSEKDDELKKAYTKLIKRVIIIVILFILPLLINWILAIFFPGLNTCI